MNYHTPVLLKESMDLLITAAGGTFVDATMGGGGHTEAMLQNPKVKHVYAFDQDADAIEFSAARLSAYNDKLTIIKSNFADMRTQLALQKVKTIDGALFDLGVSSHQIDSGERGFSFEQDAPLDMRMDRHQENTVKDLINTASVETLAGIFRKYGEEKDALRVAKWIETARKNKPIDTTLDLARIIDKNMRSNPILIIKTKARIFQALRIFLNSELELLESTLEDAINLLNPQGRLVVISYHSLEDRIVKTGMNAAAQGCICPKNVMQCACNRTPKVKILTNKPIQPSEEEQKSNNRSRSAKMRAVEKVAGGTI